MQEEPLRAGRAAGRPGVGCEDRRARGACSAATAPWEPVETERGDYGAFYAGVVAALRDGAPAAGARARGGGGARGARGGAGERGGPCRGGARRRLSMRRMAGAGFEPAYALVRPIGAGFDCVAGHPFTVARRSDIADPRSRGGLAVPLIVGGAAYRRVRGRAWPAVRR